MVGGGEEDPRAVGGHPVVEDAGAGAGGEVDGVGGGPDVHVEVVVVVAVGIGGDLLADQDP